MITQKKLKFYGYKDIDSLPQLKKLSDEERFNLKVVAAVLPFRANNYVVEELIDWDNIPNDPIYQLTFPQKGMLESDKFGIMASAMKSGASPEEIQQVANDIRYELNPHPAGQMTANVPLMDDEPVQGLQHKYKETALVFPSSGQTCHAYCTFCFRWAQFVGLNDLKFATDESLRFQKYLKEHKEITDVLFTGGDPMVMSLKKLKVYLEPLLQPEFSHIRNIRIGTKSISYWPYKYVTDKDSDELMQFFEKITASGKHLAIMAHFNHWQEMNTEVAHEAIRRIRSTGAEIRSQSPLLRNINDDGPIWKKMWEDQVKLGVIPYYMFVERDTGAEEYFKVPLTDALKIFRDAFTKVSGLARTVRGPSMSCTPGKVAIEGVTEINGEKVFMLNMLQGRNANWVKKPFFAKYDEDASWWTHLEPALGRKKFFFTDELENLLQNKMEDSGSELHIVA